MLLELVQRLASFQHNFKSGLSASTTGTLAGTPTPIESSTEICKFVLEKSNPENSVPTQDNVLNNGNLKENCNQEIVKNWSSSQNEIEQTNIIGSNNGNIDSTTVDIDNDVNEEMGSNVSRHSGKGLSGRRTQSSGKIFFFFNISINRFCPNCTFVLN